MGDKDKRIMFFGPSGTGKTTLAKYVSEKYNIPFISGSISDLIPKTKDLSHQLMMSRDPKTILLEDLQLLSLRSKVFSKESSFVTDRSYLDIMGYHIIKSSKDISECDSDTLFSNVATLLLRDCTHLVFVPFTNDMFYNWKIQDNGKRVLNRYFQWQVSLVMRGLLNRLGFSHKLFLNNYGTIQPEIICRDIIKDKSNKKIEVCIIDTVNIEHREIIIDNFIS